MKPRDFAICAVLALSMAPMAGGLAHAETKSKPKPFPEFSAKRIKPPKPGEGPRITVQIDPEAEKPIATPAATPDITPATPASPGRYTWFWDTISPELTQSGPGRRDANPLRIGCS